MDNLYTGDSGVQLVAPMNNAAIVLDGTWTITFNIGLVGETLQPHTGTYSEDGTQALYTLVGTELPNPGTYAIVVTVTKGGINKTCRVTQVVCAAET